MADDPKFAVAEITDHVEGLHGLGNLADSLTNSCMQAIRKEMDKQGLHGGLRDSRSLRTELHKVISADIGDQTAFITVEKTDAEQDRRHGVHLRLTIFHEAAAHTASEPEIRSQHNRARRLHAEAAAHWGDIDLWRKAMKASIELCVPPHFYD